MSVALISQVNKSFTEQSLPFNYICCDTPVLKMQDTHEVLWFLRIKFNQTKISGPYGPFEIIAPAGGLLASLA